MRTKEEQIVGMPRAIAELESGSRNDGTRLTLAERAMYIDPSSCEAAIVAINKNEEQLEKDAKDAAR